MGVHINPRTGKPGECRANIACPFGGSADEHFESVESAREGYERAMTAVGAVVAGQPHLTAPSESKAEAFLTARIASAEGIDAYVVTTVETRLNTDQTVGELEAVGYLDPSDYVEEDSDEHWDAVRDYFADGRSEPVGEPRYTYEVALIPDEQALESFQHDPHVAHGFHGFPHEHQWYVNDEGRRCTEPDDADYMWYRESCIEVGFEHFTAKPD